MVEEDMGNVIIPSHSIILSKSNNDFFLRPVSKTKIESIVQAMSRNKTPGPDGFPPFFFKHYYPIIQHDVCLERKQFFTNNSMLISWKLKWMEFFLDYLMTINSRFG